MLPLDVPIDIGRADAADAARRELSKTIYAAGRPSIEQRVISWVLDQLLRALDALSSVAPGGILGLIVLVALGILVIVLVRRQTGPLRRADAGDVPLFVGRLRSAAEYRAAANTAAAAGDWDEAVRQRFRAVVRSLEERDILEPRPGRTAGEATADAARALPSCAPGLRVAARSFDDVAYGGRARDQQADAQLRELDQQLAAARPIDDSHPAGHLADAFHPVR